VREKGVQGWGLAMVQTFVSRLLDLKLPFTRLRIGSLDNRILFNLQRLPGRVRLYPMTLTDERKEKMQVFCARKGLEPFAEYLGFEPWSSEAIIGYTFKGDAAEVATLVTELLASVYGAEPHTQFGFDLM
jgi:hypothetical protein